MRVAGEGGEAVTIRVGGRMHPDATDYWDGNWLLSPIEVVVGGFTGRVQAGLRADELVSFREQLQELHRTLEGEAKLESLENWLILVATGDGLGHVEVTGAARDEPGMGNELRFGFTSDQTFLPEIIDALLQVEQLFPVLGAP